MERLVTLMELMKVETCINCEGWGFEVVLKTRWEEDEASPQICENCGGTGLFIYLQS